MTNAETTLLSRMYSTISEHRMLPGGAPLLVMVSGGGDSVALLRMLTCGEDVHESNLRVLHVDHRLRGSDSDEDAEFVRNLSDELGVSCEIEHVDIRELAQREGINLEDAGRRERYRLADLHLDAMCDGAGVGRDTGRVAVAHTRDDRIETFLMRLAQGAGSSGLTSLRPVRGRVIRPLIDCSRDDVRDYLGVNGWTWREDTTNTDTDRLRAKVRHEIAPLLRDINPRFDEAFARTLLVLTDEDDLLDEMASAFSNDFIERDDGEIRFDRAMMATLSRPMARRTVRAALIDEFPEASRLEFEHVEALVDGLSEDGFARDLPEGLRAFTEYGRMVVSCRAEGPGLLAPCLLPIPGIVDFGSAGRLIAEVVDTADIAGSTDSIVIDLSDEIDCLDVGGPRQGDRMQPLGMHGSKKLSDLLVDEKVPRRDRPITPVVRRGEEIVWLAGVRMSDAYRVTESTRRAVRLTWDRRNSGYDELDTD